MYLMFCIFITFTLPLHFCRIYKKQFNVQGIIQFVFVIRIYRFFFNVEKVVVVHVRIQSINENEFADGVILFHAQILI